MTPIATPIAELTDERMKQLASQRAQVYLHDGRIATLRWWKLPQKGNYARVEFNLGKCATLRISEFVAVVEQDNNLRGQQ